MEKNALLNHSSGLNWSSNKEQDVMSILMDSSLFYELSLDERNKLIRQVIETYLSA